MAVPQCLQSFLVDNLTTLTRMALLNIDLDGPTEKINELAEKIDTVTANLSPLIAKVNAAQTKVDQIQDLIDRATDFILRTQCPEVISMKERLQSALIPAQAALSFSQAQLSAVNGLKDSMQAELDELRAQTETSAWREYDSFLRGL